MSHPALTTLVGFTSNPKTAIASIDWTALQKVESDGIKSYLRALHSADRGRTRERERTEPGLSEFTLDNRDRRFEPEFTGSPYSPNVLPGKPVRHGLGYMPLVVASKPVAYWRLGEAAGATTALDEMNSFNLTKTGAPTFGVAGRIPGNTAVEFFNNSADHLSTTAFTPALESGFTFAAWIKPDSVTVQRLIVVKGSASERDIDIRHTTAGKADLSFVAADALSNDIQGTTTLEAGQWYFIVGTWDDVRSRLYLNGALEATSADLSAEPPRDGGNVVRIGRNVGTDSPFDGVIDEVAIWDRALSAAEIKALYDEGVKNIQDGWIWHGYMEGWPPSYPAFGKDAVTNAVATDALSLLAQDNLSTPYKMRTRPGPIITDISGYWRLNETSETDEIVDYSGKGRPGSYTLGNVVLEQESPVTGEKAIKVTDNRISGAVFDLAAGVAGSGAFSAAVWLNVPAAWGSTGIGLFMHQSWSLAGSWQIGHGTDGLTFAFTGAGTNAKTTIPFDEWVFVVCVRESDGDLVIYKNGTLATLQARAIEPLTARAILLGSGAPSGQSVLYAQPTIWPVALTASQVTALYGARMGWANDKSGTRIGNVLDAVGWPTADRDLDGGQSQIQIQDEETTALSHILDVADWDGGYFFPTEDGKLRFDDRHARFYAPLNTSQATFAWSPTGSERAIRGAQLDHHWRNVKNYIMVERVNGTTAVAQDTTSIASYKTRRESRSSKVVLDNEVLSDAQSTLVRKKDPRYEIEFLEIRPGNDNDLWNQVVTREMGDRITLILRPPGGGAQLSKDFHIEHIHHECTTPTTKDWFTRWRLSPVYDPTKFVWDVSQWDNDAAWVH